jgi:hypothetical protein
MTTALKTQVGAELSEREIRILRAIQTEQTAEYEFRRDTLRLRVMGLVKLSPYPASLGGCAGSHVFQLTDAGAAIVEGFYHG